MYNEIFRGVCTIVDDDKEATSREYRDTMQELMIELKLKSDKLFKKFKELSKKDKFRG